ncbi:MAG: hypothetical protein GWN13_00925 [Phycisphaerae bacterium]|nr:hypothetical protein [Phycisphaerae bacterium]
MFHLETPAQVVNKKLTGQSFRAEITVAAATGDIWAILTDLHKISKVMGYDFQGTPVKFTRPGDNAKMTIWGDTGTYILIYHKPGSELQFMWEPDNATYICQQRWLISEAGKNTKVVFEERYTESGPQSEADIKAQVDAYNQALARFKAMCESNGE